MKEIDELSKVDRSCELYNTDECLEKDEPLIICKTCTKSKNFVGYKKCPICDSYMNLTQSECGRYPVLKCSHCYVDYTGYLRETASQIWARWNTGKAFEKISEMEKLINVLNNAFSDINEIIYAKDICLGSKEYFKIRNICCNCIKDIKKYTQEPPK